MALIVQKYGGTSVGSVERIEAVAERVAKHHSDGDQLIIVVSAMSGETNRLLGLARDLTSNPSPRELDVLVSTGEQVSMALLAMALHKRGIDALSLKGSQVAIRTDSFHSKARIQSIDDRRLRAELDQGRVVVVAGFQGVDENGEVTTLGRGGSDTSAALAGALVGADRVEIYSDVPGLFTADPYQIPTARLIKVASYREAQELAAMGAKAIHPHALAPLKAFDIPLWLKSTHRPDIEGTKISSKAKEHGAQVKAIVQRRQIALISLEGIGMWQQVGFLADVFSEFKQLGLSVDQISTSESNVTLTLDLVANVAKESDIEQLIDRLKHHCQVEWVPDCACVSLVGLGIRTILHRLGPALEVFEQRRIFQVSQAANDLNLTFVVEARHADRLVQQLHQQLIPGGLGGDSVFGPTWEQLFQRKSVLPQTPAWWVQKKEQLQSLMETKDSLYVYHLPTITEAAQKLSQLQAIDRVLYSMKANPHPEILKAIIQAGLGIECVSYDEVMHARQHLPTLEPKEILFTPNFASRQEYLDALNQGVTLTIDNAFILEHWGADFTGREVFLRLDPGSGLGHHKMVRTAGSHAKFGIPLADLNKVAQLAQAHQVTVTGLHAHTGSGILHPDNWHRTLEMLGRAAETFPDVKVIDIGGGLGIPDHDDALPLDLESLDSGIEKLKQKLPRSIDVWLEPGRFLVANAGVLLARVTQTKGKGDIRYVGLTTGMNSLIRPALYGAWHPIHHLDRLGEAGEHVYNVVGPICETGDVLGLDRLLPHCEPGDLMLIANTGAYGRVMSSHYNLRTPADEYIIRS